MLISSVKHRMLGQVHFTVSGLTLEKLLNIACQHDIPLYQVERTAYTGIRAKVSALHYKKLQRLLPEGHYKMIRQAVTGTAGLTFILRKRYALLVGLLLCIAVLLTGSQRIWMVSVQGASTVSTQLIEDEMQKYQLLTWKNDIDSKLEAAEKSLLKDIPELSWVSLSVRGVVLHVYVKEKPAETESVPRDTPADIIATKDAVIEQVTVLQGTAAVKKGQTVAKGQTLISGQLVFSDVPYRYISAQGVVKAKVWYYDTVVEELTMQTTERTGRSCFVRTMNFLGKEIVLEGKNTFSKSEFEEYSTTMTSLGLPLEVTNRTYYELRSKTVTVSEEDAIAEAERKILDKIQQDIPDDAVFNDRQTTVEKQDDGKLKVTMYVETIEKIGFYKELQ